MDCSLDSIEEVGERRMLAKLTSIMDNPSHPPHHTVGALSSSAGVNASVDPSAIRVINNHC